jgi:hypothetical protein
MAVWYGRARIVVTDQGVDVIGLTWQLRRGRRRLPWSEIAAVNVVSGYRAYVSTYCVAIKPIFGEEVLALGAQTLFWRRAERMRSRVMPQRVDTSFGP